MGERREAACGCGRTAVEVSGEPILGVVCCCESCRKAARQFEAEPGAPEVVRPDGGVAYCLYRKDRARVTRGAEHLREHRLTPASPTRRVVAACCNAPMFVDFTPGHWLTLYRDRLAGEAPPLRMRIMAEDAPEGARLDDGLATYRKFPARLLLKQLAAWAAMGFRRPTITW